MTHLERYPLWEEARNIPNMSNYEIYTLWRDKKLSHLWEQINDKCTGHIKLAEIFKDYTPNELVEVIKIMRSATQSAYFRTLIEYQLETVENLYFALDNNFDPMSHDLSSVQFAPVHTEGAFKAWMNNGIGVEIALISDAIYCRDSNRHNDKVRFISPVTKIEYEFIIDEVLAEERLKQLHTGWTILFNKLSEHIKNNDKGAYYFIDPGKDNIYSRVFDYLKKLYGQPMDDIPIMEITADWHKSSFSLNDFEKYLSPWQGDASNFICGTDDKIGFIEDLYMLKKAIEAEKEGKEFITAHIITDWITGEESEFRFRVADLLSYERCKNFSYAIVTGARRMVMITSDSETDEAKQLRKLSLDGWKDEPYATVYRYMMTDFVNNKCTKPSVNNILQSATGDK